jgi:CRP-like cAMP-binding protein
MLHQTTTTRRSYSGATPATVLDSIALSFRACRRLAFARVLAKPQPPKAFIGSCFLKAFKEACMLPLPTTNKLLSALPPEDRQRISSYLTVVPAPFKTVFYEQDGPIHDVYFPCSGAWSLMKTMDEGGRAEVATVGNEGMLGSAIFFGDRQSHTEAVVQIAGEVDAYKMPVAAFMAEMELRGAFFNRVIRYHQAQAIQIQQTTACNALHHAEQRCCRWLLMSRDRVGSDEMKLTHEFLAVMLGVRRPTVTLVVGALERAGLVVNGHRGAITISDPKGLEAASCECYATVKANFARLLPEIPVPPG